MWLTTIWKSASSTITIILLILVGILAFYANSMKSVNAALVAQKATLLVTLTESQANVIQLKNDINFQNAQIEKFKSDAAERAVKHANDIKKAKTTSDMYRKQAEDLLNRRPPQNITKCDAANDLIVEELKDANK